MDAEARIGDTFREIELTAKAIRDSAQRVAVAAESLSSSTLRASYLAGLRDGAISVAIVFLLFFAISRGFQK